MTDYVLPRKPEPSQEYIELLDAYKEMHSESGAFKGISLVPFILVIKDLIKENECKTLFDYGCGKGIPYHKEYFKAADPKNKWKEFDKPIQDVWGIDEFFLYDPAYPDHDKLPNKKYDMVVCTDVLEHIPEDDLDWIIREILHHSNKVVFINVCAMKALKTFQKGKHKGRNVHVSLFSHNEWVERLANIWRDFKHLKIYLATTGDKGEKSLKGVCIKRNTDSVKKPKVL